MASMESYHHPETVYVPGPTERIVAYVYDGGFNEYMSEEVRVLLVPTLNAALARCRSGYNDVVVVLPGHAENVSSADQMSSLVAGTKIVGLGANNNRPTFTWSAATATFLIDVANVTIENCIFEWAGDPTSTTALDVAAPMTVSAAGFTLRRCKIRSSVDADQFSSIGLTTTAAADDMLMEDCFIHGQGDGSGITTVIRLVGADRFTMRRCTVDAYTSSTTVGVLQMLTTASTQVQVEDCVFVNRKAASVHAATGMAAATGNFVRCHFGILDNATTAGFETEGSLQFFDCSVSNDAGAASAAKTPA